MNLEKEYLGDGVYVVVENGMLKLTTEDGYHATNTIFLEVEVLHAFLVYVKRLAAAKMKLQQEAKTV
jgi:hypothetical protein